MVTKPQKWLGLTVHRMPRAFLADTNSHKNNAQKSLPHPAGFFISAGSVCEDYCRLAVIRHDGLLQLTNH